MLFKYHLFLDRRQLLSLFFAIFSGWMTAELIRDEDNAWWVLWGILTLLMTAMALAFPIFSLSLAWDFSMERQIRWAPPGTHGSLCKRGTCFSVSKSCPTLFNPVDCNAPGSSVLDYFPGFAQIRVC